MPLRVGLIAVLIVTAALTCMWRAIAGHDALPGIYTVVFLPLSVALFVVADRVGRFQPGAWVAVSGVVVVHLVGSVPVPGGPLYYRGSDLVRGDHAVHLFAGGLVASLCWDVVRRIRPTLSRRGLMFTVLVLALAFGAMKETTDYLSVHGAGRAHDTFDSAADFILNLAGAALALPWASRRNPVYAEPAGERPEPHLLQRTSAMTSANTSPMSHATP